MHNCISCGASLEPSDQFCIGCGSHVDRPDSGADKPNDQGADFRLISTSGCCPHCGAIVAAGERFCTACGVEACEAVAPYCPKCSAVYDAESVFCEIDGSSLILPHGHPERAEPSFSFPAFDDKWQAHAGNIGSILRAFWFRHKILVLLTLVPILPLIFELVGFAQIDEGILAVAIGLLLTAAVSWPIALMQSEKALNGVYKMDDWFERSAGYLRNSEGKFRRWVLFPILWLASKFMLLSRKAPDPFSAAAIRTYCYLATVMIVIAIVTFAIMLFLALFMIGITLAILSAVMGDGPSVPDIGKGLGRNIAKRAVRRTGKEQKLFEGGSWWSEKRTGRVDEDGNIYGGSSRWTDKRVGRVDDDGKIYEGSSRWTDERTGRVDKDGKVYEGSSAWTDKRTGRIDEDGKVHKGSSAWTDERSGRIEED
jgi:Double zinc ribbon